MCLKWGKQKLARTNLVFCWAFLCHTFRQMKMLADVQAYTFLVNTDWELVHHSWFFALVWCQNWILPVDLNYASQVRKCPELKFKRKLLQFFRPFSLKWRKIYQDFGLASPSYVFPRTKRLADDPMYISRGHTSLELKLTSDFQYK